MSDLLRRLGFFGILITIIASVWTAAWAKAQGDQANRSYWPAEHPEMFHFDQTGD